MVEAITFWNEPNNLSHWNFEIDPDWRQFTEMTRRAARAVRALCPGKTLVLGGLSPIDSQFAELLKGYGLLDELDVVSLHGFPLDWNHWKIGDWPSKIEEIRAVVDRPIWINEVGASSFGAEEVQVFGLRRMSELLIGRVERIFWYSLLDLPPTWEATTRHKESEGSSYYRHYYMGLIRHDGSPKPAVEHFDPRLGICQWFAFQDERLDLAMEWLERLGVRKLRTGISWADWHRPNAVEWFDEQMDAIRDLDVTITLCFTPPSRGIRPCHTSPPVQLEEFAQFASEIVRRYVSPEFDSEARDRGREARGRWLARSESRALRK